MATLFNAN